ncbi:phospholipase A-2-activating protein-like [Uloborus diversus]|uniref:phospholipase A-2-activating protein-like n=1 Tax=Uloborus diversus TaxID=327109 RepID=UPI0024096BA7|nr:phospholipase A-2-activating protein-like [Uloborus diversus]
MEIDHEEMGVKYAVKYAIPAHNGDVRTIAATRYPENSFVTGSRDRLVKLWAPNTDGGYNEATVFCGATKYVSSLCALPASDEYPEGLILAGSNDCYIYGFAINHAEPVMKLLAHSGNVCSLSAGPIGTFVSGSWDKTARVWSGQKCHLVLSGHQEAVWAAEFLPEPNLVLTASADHTIRLWCSEKCEKVYEGHTDCVRGLAVLRVGNFLSCSNDYTVRLWSIEGNCLAIYKSHSSYIYGITLLNTGGDFATCGEDGRVKIWRNGDCVQSINFSGKTLWSITCASNGNLAVGCSDGTLYILGEIPTGDAPGEVLEEKHLREIFGKQHNVDSTILDKGDFDGETRLVFEQENDCMVVYSWDATTSQWKKKDVVSEGVIGNIAKSHQVNKEGVKTLNFNVDVEGVMYQIGYKAGENPWDVAQKFVVEHNLAVDHIAQIATFILDKTGDGSWNANDVLYKEKFISYSISNVDGLAAKLAEFNSKVGKEHQLSEDELKSLMVLVTLPKTVTVNQMTALETALMWEDEYLYPVLDLLRLAVKSVGMHSNTSNPSFINYLLQVLPSNEMLDESQFNH